MEHVSYTKGLSFKSQVAKGTLLEKLVIDILKAKSIFQDLNTTVYQLEDGSMFEFIGSSFFHPAQIFEKGNLVLSFQVEDIVESVDRLTAAGAVLIDEIIRPCNTYAYCYLIIDGQQIIGLHQEEASVRPCIGQRINGLRG